MSRSQREAGMARLLFSIFVVSDNKKREKQKRWELQSRPFFSQQKQQLCPVNMWIPDKDTASHRTSAGGLQATHRRLYKGTPFSSAVGPLLCL